MALPAASAFTGASITEAQFKTAMTSLVEYLEDLETITPGMVAYFPQAAAPTGWLKANGAAVSRSTYSTLFATIGTTFGVGDGSTTFNLPDLRGEFLRGLDDGRGVDAARAIGSAQSDAIKSHNHSYTLTVATGLYGSSVPVASTNTSPSSTSKNTDSTGGAETRPRNIALLACIKY